MPNQWHSKYLHNLSGYGKQKKKNQIKREVTARKNIAKKRKYKIGANKKERRNVK